MAKIDFETLRRAYIIALDAYHNNAQKVAEHTKNGVRPSVDELRNEEHALYHFAKARRDMLDALTAIQHYR